MTWQIASFCILAVVLGGAFLWYERRRPPARVLALVAVLAGLAVVGRLAFAAIPNVKPTTDIVLFAGYALGGVPGFAVGAITALVSNIFMSQGPWTPWQMVAWGGVGVSGAALAWATRGRALNRWQLAIACGVAAAAFGAFMDLYQWTQAAQQTLGTYVATAATSAPYNIAHVASSVVFCLLIGPAFVRALQRYRRRVEVRWERRPAYGAIAVVLLALVVVVGSTTQGSPNASAAPLGVDAAPAASPAGMANAYLLRAQNADGGFGGAPGSSSAELATGWAILGLAANGNNPQDVKRKNGRSALAYLERSLRGLNEIGDIQRTILAVEAAGKDAHRFGGRNLVAEMLKKRGPDGSFANFVSYTAFGIVALRAAGDKAGSASLKWLTESQNEDGGFGLTREAPSDADITGMALQAYGAVGRTASPAVRRAVDWLHSIQGPDGGFGQMAGQPSNSQSTSYAIQGLVAVGADDAAVDRARRYVSGLRQRNGSVGYSASSRQTPVWVTAQALLALRKAPFPLAPVPVKVKPKPTKASENETPSDGGSSGGGSGAAAPPSSSELAPAAPAPSEAPAPPAFEREPEPEPKAPAAAAPPAPTPTTPVPQSVPTPEPDPGDAASAERAAAGAGDDGVPPGLAIGIAAAVIALLAALWLFRRPLTGLARRGGTLLPGKLRRST